MIKLVLDTNIFIAAGFNPGSHAARIIKAIRQRRATLVYDDATLHETRQVLEKIPPMDFARFADLFEHGTRYHQSTGPERFDEVPDPSDRKFIALADAAEAVLVTNDEHLLGNAQQSPAKVLTPSQCIRELGLQAAPPMQSESP